MVLSLVHLLLFKLQDPSIFYIFNHLYRYHKEYQTIKLLLQYVKLEELNKFKINIIHQLVKKKISMRQIMYCLIKEDYEMNYINNYDKESWNYKTDLIYIKFRIYTDASKFWYYNNMLHNDDIDENNKLMPAIIDEYGDNYYYINDILLKY